MKISEKFKGNWLKALITLTGLVVVVGWYIYNINNYTFYYSNSEKTEIMDTRNKRNLMSLKLEIDDCFWKSTYDCHETLRALKFKGYITEDDWKTLDDNFYHQLSDNEKEIRLTALNKMYDERKKEIDEYKNLKNFNQFIFEEFLIFLGTIALLYIFKSNKIYK